MRRSLYIRLVEAHAAELYRFSYRLCGRADIAEDLVQETFYEAWRSIGSLRSPDKGRAWLYKILRRRFARHLRDRSRSLQDNARHGNLEQGTISSGPDMSKKLAERDMLQKAIDTLESRYKEPFLMVFLEGLSCREAAEELDIPLGTVLSRIHRARSFLRQAIERQEAGFPGSEIREEEEPGNIRYHPRFRGGDKT